MEITTLLVTLLFGITITSFVRWWLRRSKYVNTINKIPGHPTVPIFGNVLQYRGMKRTETFDRFITKQHYDFPGGICRTWMFHRAQVFLSKPEFVEKLLSSSKNITKAIGYELEFKKWLGKGLVTSTGEHWQAHRKVITPTFHFSILEGFCDVFSEKCEILARKLTKYAETGEVVNVYPIINYAALDIICETAMGIKTNAQDTMESKYLDAASTLTELTLKRIVNPLLLNEFIFSLTSDNRRSREALKILHTFTNNVIAERKILRKYESKSKEENNEFGQKRRLAFLDLLLEESEKHPLFTDQDVREEVDTFISAGHDTTTVSTSWALFILGHHPEIQAKLYDEQFEIFGDSDALPTYKDLGEMKYMERVMKECIRLYPTIPQVARRITDDFEVGGYTIPTGCTVVLSIWACSRDERFFPDPEKFDPDRWLPENNKNRHAYAHIPFSAGPRNCIGQKFAQLEEKVMLSTMIRNFKWKSVDSREEIKILPEVVARPYPGVNLVLEKRRK